MKTSLFVGTALGALLFSSSSFAAEIRYHADLSPDNEPALADQNAAMNATGTVDAILDDTTKTLCGTVTFSGLSGAQNGIHIHDGNNGDVVIKTINAGGAASPVSFSFTLTNTEATDLAGGGYYVNVHTAANPDGEERGDLGTTNVNATYACPAADAGTTTDAGTTSSSSSSSSGSSGASSSSSGATSTSSSSGATTERPDSGTTAAAPKSDSGCSTTGSDGAPVNGLAIALGLGVAIAGFARAKKKR